jgi:hypothetical protein
VNTYQVAEKIRIYKITFMKQVTTTLLLIIFSATTFSQQTDSPPTLTKQDYLKKSKSQNTAAWILAGAGTGLIVVAFATTNVSDIGDAINGDNSGLNSGTALFVTGAIVAVSSIPLFIIAAKNKRRAMSIAFKNEPVFTPFRIDIMNSTIPSFTLKFSL